MHYGDTAVQQRINEFHKANGGDAASIFKNHNVYYENGAIHADHPLGALVDPPADIRERLKRRILFYKLKLNDAVAAFDEQRNVLLATTTPTGQGRVSDRPLKEEMDKLKELHGVVQSVKKQMEAVEQEQRELEAGDQRQRDGLLVELLGIEDLSEEEQDAKIADFRRRCDAERNRRQNEVANEIKALQV